MRKIETLQEKEKRRKRNQIIVGIILVVIMVISTAGYALYSNPEENKERIEHNGVKFIIGDDGYWRFNVQGSNFLTKFNPKETEDINIPVSSNLNNYKGNPLYFVAETGSEKAVSGEIVRNLAFFFSRTQFVCLLGEDCLQEDLPLKDCSENVVIIREKNETKIRQDGNCIFIEAPYEELERVCDAFLFKILGL